MRGLAVVTVLAVALSVSPAAADTVPTDRPPLRVASAAAAEAVPYLPDPTGRKPVGVTSLYLRDSSRRDPWVRSVSYRELMVSLYYPATSADGPTKQYMTPFESRRYPRPYGIPDLPLDALSRVRTNAVVDARPAGRHHPLIVLSPGFINSRVTLSALAENLASHGYVMAVVDHTYENRATTFPAGRVSGCAACNVDDRPGFWNKLAQTRPRAGVATQEHPWRRTRGRRPDPRRRW